MSDPVKNPGHYADGPVPGIECIQVSQWFNFNCGNVIKYVWRHGYKGKPLEDLKKARQYLDFEIARLEGLEPEPETETIDTLQGYSNAKLLGWESAKTQPEPPAWWVELKDRREAERAQ